MLLVCDPLTCTHIHISHSLSVYLGQGLFRTKKETSFSDDFAHLITFSSLILLSLPPLSSVMYFSAHSWRPPRVDYSHIALSFRLLLFLFFSCLLAFSLFSSCLLMCCVCFYGFPFFFSALILLKMEWWFLHYCYILKNVVPVSGVLLWMSVFPYCIVYYISAATGEVREVNWLTQTSLLCVCACRQAVDGFPLSLRRRFQFPRLSHTNLFNGSFVNVRTIGWITLQRWN